MPISQLIDEVKTGNFTNIFRIFGEYPVFENYCDDIITAIINGCSINKDTKVLYLIFLEVAKVIDTPVEDISLNELKSARSTLLSERKSPLESSYSKDFLEKWFRFQVQEKKYSKLMKQIFDVAHDICQQNHDYYAAEIIRYMCTHQDVEYRKYALLNINNVECFLEDKDEELTQIAHKIMEIKELYNKLPLDAKLLVDLLETGIKVGSIKIINGYKVCSSLFTSYCELSIPNFCLNMTNKKVIAYIIYEAIVNRDLEFVEEKTPSFYKNLLCNNPRTL